MNTFTHIYTEIWWHLRERNVLLNMSNTEIQKCYCCVYHRHHGNHSSGRWCCGHKGALLWEISGHE